MTPQPGNLDAWMRQANAMQAEMHEARSRLLETEVTGASGPVTICLGASGDLRDILIEGTEVPDVASLRRHILTAHERAIATVRAMAQDMMRPLHSMISSLERLEM